MSEPDALAHYYLSIELVSAANADDAPAGEVLYVSEPFVPSLGRHGLVLARHELPPGRVLSVPDTGDRNVLLVIEGAVVSQWAGSLAPETLLAGEATVFRGMREISMPQTEGAQASGADAATIVVASVGAVTVP